MTKTFLLTFGITVLVVGLFILLLNYCRQRLRKTPHGLTGICHKDGGRICSSCATAYRKEKSGGDDS